MSLITSMEDVRFKAYGRYPKTDKWCAGLSKSIEIISNEKDNSTYILDTVAGDYTLTKTLSLENGFMSLVESVLATGQINVQIERKCRALFSERVITIHEVEEVVEINQCTLLIHGNAIEMTDMLETMEPTKDALSLCKEFTFRTTQPKKGKPIDMKACDSIARARSMITNHDTHARITITMSRQSRQHP